MYYPKQSIDLNKLGGHKDSVLEFYKKSLSMFNIWNCGIYSSVYEDDSEVDRLEIQDFFGEKIFTTFRKEAFKKGYCEADLDRLDMNDDFRIEIPDCNDPSLLSMIDKYQNSLNSFIEQHCSQNLYKYLDVFLEEKPELKETMDSITSHEISCEDTNLYIIKGDDFYVENLGNVLSERRDNYVLHNNILYDKRDRTYEIFSTQEEIQSKAIDLIWEEEACHRNVQTFLQISDVKEWLNNEFENQNIDGEHYEKLITDIDDYINSNNIKKVRR